MSNKTTYIVYKHTNKINNKIYIGITKYGDNPNIRWRNGMGYTSNKKFFSDILKYGWNNFNHEILEQNLTLAQASKKEAFYIQQYNSVENGYNQIYSSGEITKEGYAAISKALTGIKRKQESIEKQMATKKERYGSGRGIHYLGNSKKVICNETGDIFASLKEAERWSGSTKICDCCKGNRKTAGKHPITGQSLTWSYAPEDSIVTISCEEDRIMKTIKQVQCIETQNIYDSAAEAYRQTGIAACNILRVCRGLRQTAGGFHWQFIEEKEE